MRPVSANEDSAQVKHIARPPFEPAGGLAFPALPIANRHHMDSKGTSKVGLEQMQFQAPFLDLVANRSRVLGEMLTGFPMGRVWNSGHPNSNGTECQKPQYL
jgi:hypothetical protein